MGMVLMKCLIIFLELLLTCYLFVHLGFGNYEMTAVMVLNEDVEIFDFGVFPRNNRGSPLSYHSKLKQVHFPATFNITWKTK